MGNNLSHSSEKDIKVVSLSVTFESCLVMLGKNLNEYEDFSVARSTGFPQAKILLVFLIIHG